MSFKFTFVMSLLIVLLFACGAPPEDELNPDKVVAKVSTNPSTPAIKQPFAFKVELSGVPAVTNQPIKVELDYRPSGTNELPVLLEAQQQTTTTFVSSTTTIDDKGLFDVYVHIYQGENHVIKKAKLVVE